MILTILTMFTALGHESAKQPGVTVELRAFIAHCDSRDRGLSCVVVNGTAREVTVWKGYDGERNRMVSRNERHPIGLRPEKKPELRRVMIQPGMSETIFTLSLDAIFFLDPTRKREGWHWGWAGRAPRGAPPVSPFHGQAGLGWEAHRAESGIVAAEIEVDGRSVESRPLEIRAAKPRTDEVAVLARFQSARLVVPETRERRYEITFTVLKKYAGSLTKDERTLTMPSDSAEQLMRAAGARPAGARGYDFTGPMMLLSFSRVTAEDGKRSRLVLMSYERRPKPHTP